MQIRGWLQETVHTFSASWLNTETVEHLQQKIMLLLLTQIFSIGVIVIIIFIETTGVKG